MTEELKEKITCLLLGTSGLLDKSMTLLERLESIYYKSSLVRILDFVGLRGAGKSGKTLQN